jgi:hypothetical protein
MVRLPGRTLLLLYKNICIAVDTLLARPSLTGLRQVSCGTGLTARFTTVRVDPVDESTDLHGLRAQITPRAAAAAESSRRVAKGRARGLQADDQGCFAPGHFFLCANLCSTSAVPQRQLPRADAQGAQRPGRLGNACRPKGDAACNASDRQASRRSSSAEGRNRSRRQASITTPDVQVNQGQLRYYIATDSGYRCDFGTGWLGSPHVVPMPGAAVAAGPDVAI